MFATERQKKIQQVLLEYKTINVSSLARMMRVTEVTIRKDLEQLEKEGFLIRQHGGAILREDTSENSMQQDFTIPFSPINAKSKRNIAQFCVKYIQDEDIIFLGGDDISCLISEYLQQSDHLQSLIVVTNCLYVSARLALLPFVTLICTGGQLYLLNNIHAYYGDITLTALQNVYISKSFLNIDAVSYEQGYMVSVPEIAQLYQQLIPRSDEVVLTVESSKIDKRSLYHLLDFDRAQTVVSNLNVPDEFKRYCFDHDIKLFTALDDIIIPPVTE